jgi:hypothetical protein
MDIRGIIRDTPQTPAEKKAIDGINSELRKLADICHAFVSRNVADLQNRPWPLQEALWDASEKFEKNSSPENAEALALAAMKCHAGDAIDAAFSTALSNRGRVLSEGLAEPVLSWFDRAQAELEKQLTEAEAALAGQPHLTGELAAFRQRAAAALAHAAELRKSAAADPGAWLRFEIG